MKVVDETKIEKERLIRQVDTLFKLMNSSNVTKLHDYFSFGKSLYIVLSYYEGGNLKEYMEERFNKNDPLSSREANFVAYCVLNGIRDIHARNIIHRNLQPTNILLNLNPNKTIRNAVIGGFGFARILLEGQAQTIVISSYISPEIVLEKYAGKHDSRLDIWSYGMLLYFIMFGTDPSANPKNKNLNKILTTGDIRYDTEKGKKYPELVQAMKFCLVPNPKDRPTALRVLQLPVFSRFYKPAN
eukprot:TRINITY_DN11230_c0_g1_i3.p1 TRINITY_DN11230_c0_g1~~TRINITY_DN11230_c0_g1_i3.p1  ORF type:complete len:243 (+),score=63.52 TRINITY_DN11230_c0_g1_i3:144-872(+)